MITASMIARKAVEMHMARPRRGYSCVTLSDAAHRLHGSVDYKDVEFAVVEAAWKLTKLTHYRLHGDKPFWNSKEWCSAEREAALIETAEHLEANE